MSSLEDVRPIEHLDRMAIQDIMMSTPAGESSKGSKFRTNRRHFQLAADTEQISPGPDR